MTAYEYGDASETVTDQEDLHTDIRGLRLVDPGLGVWVNTGTDSEVNLLRRIFAALDLDPDVLMSTLRPTTGDPD